MKIGIIGSGPGGLTVAKILTDQGFQVSIFEKGKFLVNGMDQRHTAFLKWIKNIKTKASRLP